MIRSSLDEARRIVLWIMVVALVLGGVLGAALLLGGVGDTTAWRVESTLFGLALHCGGALIFMRRTSPGTMRWLALIALTVGTVNFLILVFSTWITDDAEKAWLQTIILAGTVVLLFPAWTLLDKSKHRALTSLSVPLGLVAAGLSIYTDWSVGFWGYHPLLERAVGVSWVLALASSMACALYMVRGHPRMRLPRLLILVFIAIAAALVCTGIIEDSFWNDDFYRRLTLVFCILSTCGVVVNAVLSRLLRPESPARGDRTLIDLELRCPKCREGLTLPTGGSSCPHCSTRFESRVLPLRCIRCDYDLSGLKEPHCPECDARY